MVAYIFPKFHPRLIRPDLLRHFAVFTKIGGRFCKNFSAHPYRLFLATMYSCLRNGRVWRSTATHIELNEDRRDFLEQLLNLDSASFDFITKKAAGLRNGIKCQVDRSLTSSGSYNVAFPIKFDDGVCWLLRIRRPRKNESRSTEEELMKSSIATMMYLKDNKRIPVPEVYFSCSNYWDNPLGAPFIVMELIDGIPISHADDFLYVLGETMATKRGLRPDMSYCQ
jgi:hypothetical protein